MNSVGANCNELKQQYDACFNSWFVDKFLKGDHEDSACAPLFRVYQACVKKAMKEQNIDFKAIAEKDFLSSEYPPKSETHTGNESTDSKAEDSNTKGNR